MSQSVRIYSKLEDQTGNKSSHHTSNFDILATPSATDCPTLFSHIFCATASRLRVHSRLSCCKSRWTLLLLGRAKYQATSSYTYSSGPSFRIQLCSAQQPIIILTWVFKWKNGWLTKILKRPFNAPNTLSMVVLSEEWRWLNNSFGHSGCLAPLYSFRW